MQTPSISLRGWHHPQFYSHRRVAESKANSRWRPELPRYLSLIKLTRLKSSSTGLQAAPPRAWCSSHPYPWPQTSFAKMGADAMSCPSHGWGDSSSIMPRVPGRGKHATQHPAAVVASSKMRGFFPLPTATGNTNKWSSHHKGWAGLKNDLPPDTHFCMTMESWKTVWYRRKHFVLPEAAKTSRSESLGNVGTNGGFPKMHKKSSSQQTTVLHLKRSHIGEKKIT